MTYVVMALVCVFVDVDCIGGVQQFLLSCINLFNSAFYKTSKVI